MVENVDGVEIHPLETTKPLENKGFDDDLGRLRSVEEESRLGDSNPGPMLYESIALPLS